MNIIFFFCYLQLDDEREKELLKELELDTDEFIQQYHLQRLLQLKEEQERRLQLNRLKHFHFLMIKGKISKEMILIGELWLWLRKLQEKKLENFLFHLFV